MSQKTDVPKLEGVVSPMASKTPVHPFPKSGPKMSQKELIDLSSAPTKAPNVPKKSQKVTKRGQMEHKTPHYSPLGPLSNSTEVNDDTPLIIEYDDGTPATQKFPNSVGMASRITRLLSQATKDKGGKKEKIRAAMNYLYQFAEEELGDEDQNEMGEDTKEDTDMSAISAVMEILSKTLGGKVPGKVEGGDESIMHHADPITSTNDEEAVPSPFVSAPMSEISIKSDDEANVNPVTTNLRLSRGSMFVSPSSPNVPRLQISGEAEAHEGTMENELATPLISHRDTAITPTPKDCVSMLFDSSSSMIKTKSNANDVSEIQYINVIPSSASEWCSGTLTSPSYQPIARETSLNNSTEANNFLNPNALRTSMGMLLPDTPLSHCDTPLGVRESLDQSCPAMVDEPVFAPTPMVFPPHVLHQPSTILHTRAPLPHRTVNHNPATVNSSAPFIPMNSSSYVSAVSHNVSKAPKFLNGNSDAARAVRSGHAYTSSGWSDSGSIQRSMDTRRGVPTDSLDATVLTSRVISRRILSPGESWNGVPVKSEPSIAQTLMSKENSHPGVVTNKQGQFQQFGQSKPSETQGVLCQNVLMERFNQQRDMADNKRTDGTVQQDIPVTYASSRFSPHSFRRSHVLCHTHKPCHTFSMDASDRIVYSSNPNEGLVSYPNPSEVAPEMFVHRRGMTHCPPKKAMSANCCPVPPVSYSLGPGRGTAPTTLTTAPVIENQMGQSFRILKTSPLANAAPYAGTGGSAPVTRRIPHLRSNSQFH